MTDENKVANLIQWQTFHSALCACAELLDNMGDDESILDTPKFLRAKLESFAAPTTSQPNEARDAAFTAGWNDALVSARAEIRSMQDNLETFGPYSQEAARVALDGAMDAIDELKSDPTAASPAQQQEQGGEEALARTALDKAAERVSQIGDIAARIVNDLAPAEPKPVAQADEQIKSAIVAALNAHTTEMEGYSYFGSNPGVKEDDYEEIADEVIAALTQHNKENSNGK